MSAMAGGGWKMELAQYKGGPGRGGGGVIYITDHNQPVGDAVLEDSIVV